MKRRKILIRAAIIISVLLLIFKGVFMYRDYKSYTNAIHKNADKIIKVNIDGIGKTIAYNAIKHPIYYYKNSKSKKDTLEVKEKKDKGFSLPANVFLYTIKGKNATTVFTSFKISDKESFKNYLKNELKITEFKNLQTLIVATNKDNKLKIAFSDNQCVLVYNPSKENIDDVFIDILIENKTLKKGDVLVSKLKDTDEHIAYISGNDVLTLRFNDGEINLKGDFTLLEYLQIPNDKSYSKFSDDSSVKFYLNALMSKNSKPLIYKDITIESDSINSYYKGNFAIEMAKSTTQIDSVVTYEYNDDFEKVETLTASEKQVPEINIQLSGKPSKLYNYLESTSIINNGKLNKEIFPLYQIKIDTTKNGLYASTNFNKSPTQLEVTNPQVFVLDVDFKKLQDQNHFPIINTYLEKLLTLKIEGNLNTEKTLNVNGKMVLKDEKINSLIQLLF